MLRVTARALVKVYREGGHQHPCPILLAASTIKEEFDLLTRDDHKVSVNMVFAIMRHVNCRYEIYANCITKNCTLPVLNNLN
jgi:hypothetical protein